MEIDPRLRLLKLISMVAFAEKPASAEHGSCGLRPIRKAGVPALAEHEGAVAHEMCMHYYGAVEHVGGSDRPTDQQDYHELADFALKFVTNASEDAELLLGTILIASLHLLMGTNALVIGRKWLDEVIDACWAVKVAASARYGLSG